MKCFNTQLQRPVGADMTLMAPHESQPPKRKTRAQVRKAIANSRLKFKMSWDELRELMREP